MQQGDQFNQVTVDWFRPGVSIDPDGLASFAANAEDIATFRRDGVVLLPGASTEWVESLRAGLQRNLDNPGQYARRTGQIFRQLLQLAIDSGVPGLRFAFERRFDRRTVHG
jgi:hypothetical protein